MKLYTVEKKSRRKRKLEWNEREFIAWDGEGTTPDVGTVVPTLLPTLEEMQNNTTPWILETYENQPPRPQNYILLANSKGDYISAEHGLGTTSCLEFILDTKQRYPKSIFVGFGFNYDIAQMLKDLPPKRLVQVYRTNRTQYCNYFIEWRPRKWLTISHRPTKRSATIYDVFGFFQSSFITACQKYLGNDPRLLSVSRGKESRSTFKWEELESFILPYCRLELDFLVEIMVQLRQDFHTIGLDLAKWYGPGAVANMLFKIHGIERFMSKEIPYAVNEAAQYAYAGGRFEQFKLGCHHNTVYEYDIRNAYATAIAQLPDLSQGTWERAESFEPGSFGVWFIEYHGTSREANQPQPLFCRSKLGSISFPREVSGWYWTPEAALVPNSVQYGWVWRSSSEAKPFDFVPHYYQERRRYKAEKNPCERAIKAILNCMYGKMAQSVGGKDGPPKWHQIEWAGWVTSYVRAQIYNAIKLNPKAIIAAETDAVFSTEPLPLHLGDELGDWELTTFDSITYLQSGFYYATKGEEVVCRYRGMDRDRETQQPVGLPYRAVLDHLRHRKTRQHGGTAPLLSSTTRFVNIGLALCTRSIFRSWETKDKRISLDQRPRFSKRYHLDCIECRKGHTLADCLHPMAIGGYSGPSYKHPLPWIMGEDDEEYKTMLRLEVADLWQ